MVGRLASQQELDSSFVRGLFGVASEHPPVSGALERHHERLLASQQPSAPLVLAHMLEQDHLRSSSLRFVNEAMRGDTPLSQPMELYLLSQVGVLAQAAVFNPNHKPTSSPGKTVLGYLAHKVRSFDISIRLAALAALQQIGSTWGELNLAGVDQLALQLIEKEQLFGEVSYIRGLLLHALEDEFYKVRSLALGCLTAWRAHLPRGDFK